MIRQRSAPKIRLYGIVTAITVLQGCHTLQSAPASVVLFDGSSLSAFDTYFPARGLNSDPAGAFRVEGGLLHLSGAENGYVITKQPFHEFRLHAEFKWGESTFGGRTGKARNNGILYNVQGPDKLWPRSIELQIQEGATGDFWMIDGAAVTGRDGKRVTGPAGAGQQIPRFGKGQWRDVLGYRDPNGDVERAHGEWNDVELVVRGDTVQHYVNGKLVNEGTHPFPTEGKIVIQYEGAEVFFRNITLYPFN